MSRSRLPARGACCVVLSDNPLTVPTNALRGLYVTETVKGGTTVYLRDPELSPPDQQLHSSAECMGWGTTEDDDASVGNSQTTRSGTLSLPLGYQPPPLRLRTGSSGTAAGN
jgi:hypothetical protein